MAGSCARSPEQESRSAIVDRPRQLLRDPLADGAALDEHFEPVKLNYELLGNSLPHLHTHVMPRYADDPKPGWPFPHPEDEPPPHPEAELRADVAALRALLRAD